MNKRNSVSTPKYLVEFIKTYFNIKQFVDPVPLNPNFCPKTHKCALSFPWKDIPFFVNPPYSNVKKFIQYAHRQYKQYGTKIILLVKTDTICTKYFSEMFKDAFLVFIPHRVRFPKFEHSARFTSVLIAFGFGKEQTFTIANL
jgi:hypothetical protein